MLLEKASSPSIYDQENGSRFRVWKKQQPRGAADVSRSKRQEAGKKMTLQAQPPQRPCAWRAHGTGGQIGNTTGWSADHRRERVMRGDEGPDHEAV